MKVYLKSGQIIKIDEVRHAVDTNGKEYVDYDEYGLPMLKASDLIYDVLNKRDDTIIEFFGKDNCLCFTTTMKNIAGIQED